MKAEQNWFTPARFAGLLALAIAGAFPQVLLGLRTFFYRDFGVLAYPTVYYHHESFWRGEWPLWNPLSNCGAPFLAQWGTMALYPFSLFYLVLPLPWSLNFFSLAHLFWAGLGMYFLAGRWTEDRFAASLAGFAFVFSGVMFSCMIWPNYLVALGWMPWVVLWTEKAWREGMRTVVMAALMATMQMLSGVPEIALLTWLLIAALGVEAFARASVPRRLLIGRVGLIIGLAAGLMAAQLLPFFDLLAQSQREPGFAGSKWSLPAWGWANLLVPLFRCFLTPQGVFFQIGQEFMSSTYLGIGVLALGCFAVPMTRHRRTWLLGGVALFGLIMALGESGWLYGWLRRFVPIVGLARYPVKFMVLAAFIFPLLAARAVRDSTDDQNSNAKSQVAGTFKLWLGTLFAIGLVLLLARIYPLPYDDGPAILRSGAGRAAFLTGLLGLLVVHRHLPSPLPRRMARVAVLGLIALDVLTHVPSQNPTLPPTALAPGLWELSNQTAPPKLGAGRVLISPFAEQRLLLSGVPSLNDDLLGKRLALWSNLHLLEGIPKVNGSSTLQIKAQAQVQALLYASTNRDLPRLADFLNVTLATTPGQVIEWTARPTALPWITGGQRPIFADSAETLSALTNASFNPREVVYLPLEAKPLIGVTRQTVVKIAPQSIAAQRIELEVEADQPSLLVIAQSHYAPWRAYVDGNATPVWRANHAFQGLSVPAGRHWVRLAYKDDKLKWGAGVSVLTLLLCGVLWLRPASSTTVGARTF